MEATGLYTVSIVSWTDVWTGLDAKKPNSVLSNSATS